MYILSLFIREFGGIKDRSFDFSRGMNLLTGDNESGKSTLISFIRFMLYGLPKRRAGEPLSDGDRAFSWENGVADGSMKIEKDGKIYRIERREQNAGGRKHLTVYDEESDRYLVGIELDTDAFASNSPLLERDVYKPRFIESRGWTVMRIFSRDWWISPAKVIKSITSVAEKNRAKK